MAIVISRRRGSRGGVAAATAPELLPYQQRYQQSIQGFAPVYQQLKQQAVASEKELERFMKEQTQIERQAVAASLAALEAKTQQLKAQSAFQERRRSQRQAAHQLQDVAEQVQKQIRQFKADIEDDPNLTDEQREQLMEDAQMQLASAVLPPQMKHVMDTLMAATAGGEGDDGPVTGVTGPECAVQPSSPQPSAYYGPYA